MIAYWDGSYVPDEEIKISPFDLGVLRGYGVFDVLRTENGKPYNVENHWKRFVNSASILGLEIPVDKEGFEEILTTLAEKNITPDVPKLNLRVVLTGGPSSDCFHPERGKETFFVLATPFVHLAESNYSQGARLVTLEYERELPEAKITNYIKAIQNRDLKKNAEAIEILFVKNGNVTEASTSNFFIVKNGILVTPKEKILRGTTRNLIIEEAQKNGWPVEERELTVAEVWEADEAFISAVNKGVVPVVRIDNQVIGSGKPGPITEKVRVACENR